MRTLIIGAALLLLAFAGATPANAQSEGIHVQGIWTVEVVNPDGSIAHRETFENALTPQGGLALIQTLLGDRITLVRAVRLFDCPDEAEPEFVSLPCTFETANVREGTTAGGDNALVARASVVADLPSGGVDLTRVDLIAKVCLANETPPQCFADLGNSGGMVLTSRTLASPIPVSDGQTVNIEVRLGFN